MANKPGQRTPQKRHEEALRRTGMTSQTFRELGPYPAAGYLASSYFATTVEGQLTKAIEEAVRDGVSIVFVPLSMTPYDPTLVTFDSSVRLVLEGENPAFYNVRAYGADNTGVIDAGPSWNALRATLDPVDGGTITASFGTYNLTTAFTFGGQDNIRLVLEQGVVLTGAALPTPTGNNFIDDRRAPFVALPTGTINQTLRHDGNDWVADSLLLNTGSYVAVGSPTGNGWSAFHVISYGDGTNAAGAIFTTRPLTAIANIRGVLGFSLPAHTSGTLGQMVGVYGISSWDRAGNTTKAAGLVGAVRNYSADGTGSLTTGYALVGSAVSNTGTPLFRGPDISGGGTDVSNYVGLYLGDVVGRSDPVPGVGDWAIWSGGGDSRFAGDITLHADSGASPSLLFQSDTITGAGSILQDAAGDLYITKATAGSWVRINSSTLFDGSQMSFSGLSTASISVANGAPTLLQLLNTITGNAFKVQIQRHSTQSGVAFEVSDELSNPRFQISTTSTRGQALLLSGLDATAPDYTFVSDPDTGVYRVGADRIGFATAGQARWEFTAAGMFAPLAANLDIATSGGTRIRNIYAASGGGLRIAGTQDTTYLASTISFGTSASTAIQALVGTSNMTISTADWIRLQCDGLAGPQVMWDSVAAGIGSWQPVTTLTMDVGTSTKVIRRAYIQDLFLSGTLDTVGMRIFNVKAYGAIGDGSTDDTTAIQAAWNAMVTAGRGILFFPPYPYRITARLDFDDGGDYFHILGRGATLRPTGTWSTAAVRLGDFGGTPVRTNFLKWDGLHIVNNSATGITAGMEMDEVFNSEFYGLLIQDFPNEGLLLSDGKGYNNSFFHCIIWLNGGHGVQDASTGAERWVPQAWYSCRFEGNGEHGFLQASDQTRFFDCTFQSNATVSSSFYDLYATVGSCESHACQFEHADPTSAAEERTFLRVQGADMYISGGAFSGNRSGATFAHTGFTNSSKVTVVGTKFRDLRDPYVADGAGSSITALGITTDNSINAPPVGAANPTNFALIGAQYTPVLRSSFLEMQGSLRNTQSGGRVVFDDSIGPLISQSMIEGGTRKSFDGWFQDDVAANQSAVALTRFSNGAAFTTKAFPIRSGSLVAVWVRSSEARTAGTLTVEVFKNGSTTGLTAVLDGTNTTFKVTTQAADLDTHVAGDDYDIRITTDASWAPTTADIRAGLEIEE